jgi:hypothetical protein
LKAAKDRSIGRRSGRARREHDSHRFREVANLGARQHAFFLQQPMRRETPRRAQRCRSSPWCRQETCHPTNLALRRRAVNFRAQPCNPCGKEDQSRGFVSACTGASYQ